MLRAPCPQELTVACMRGVLMCKSMSSSSGWVCGWWWDATKENGVGEIGIKRTILDLGEDSPSALISTWAIWALIKYSHSSNTYMSSHHIMWIGYSTSGSWWRHGIPTQPPTSSYIGSPTWKNLWWYGKIMLVQAGWFSPGSPISLGTRGTPYDVLMQWWCFLLSLWRGRIDQWREVIRSSMQTMEKLGFWWCGWKKQCLEQGGLWLQTVVFVC